MVPNELRLGNYVSFVNEKGEKLMPEYPIDFRITSINFSEVTFGYKEHLGRKIKIKDLVPIPFNNRWLEALGFIKKEYAGSHYEIKINDHFIIEIMGIAEGWFIWVKNEKNEILVSCPLHQHVHEIQNLYFCWGGKEIELKKEQSTVK